MMIQCPQRIFHVFVFAHMRMCMLSLCMRLTNEFGTQMKNTHTDLIRIRIRIYAYAISEKYAAGTVSVFRHFKIISVTLLFFCIQFRFLHYSHSIRFCQMVMFIISISLNIGNIHWIQSLKLLTRKYIT